MNFLHSHKIKVGYDHGMKLFALFSILLSADNAEFGDCRTSLVFTFQFLGEDVFPAWGDDKFLDPSCQKQIPI